MGVNEGKCAGGDVVVPFNRRSFSVYVVGAKTQHYNCVAKEGKLWTRERFGLRLNQHWAGFPVQRVEHGRLDLRR
jgi:hypothetical protein